MRAIAALVVALAAVGCGESDVVVAADDAALDGADVTVDTQTFDTNVVDATDTAPRDTTPDATFDATDAVTPGDGGDCIPVGGACPSSCPSATTGQRYEPSGDCFDPGEVFGCTHGVDAPGVARCRKQLSTGALYRFDLMEPPADDPAWGTCTDAESTAVTRWPPNGCSSDAGADACAAFDAGDGCCCDGSDLKATPICVEGAMSCPAGYGPYHGDDCFRAGGPCWYSFGIEAGADG